MLEGADDGHGGRRFCQAPLTPLKKCNHSAWMYTGVKDIGRTHVSLNNVLSEATMLKMVKKILVEDCGPLDPLEGAAPLAKDPGRVVILCHLLLCDSKGVFRGSSGTIQIG